MNDSIEVDYHPGQRIVGRPNARMGEVHYGTVIDLGELLGTPAVYVLWDDDRPDCPEACDLDWLDTVRPGQIAPALALVSEVAA